MGEVRIEDRIDGVDWVQAKPDLTADNFDNGRSPDALRRSFAQSQHVAMARDGDRVVGMARLLSDGVCNAYLLGSARCSAQHQLRKFRWNAWNGQAAGMAACLALCRQLRRNPV